MDYSLEKNGKTLVAHLKGSLNAATAPKLEEELGAQLDGIEALVIDLAELESISSLGLRVLLTLYRHMEKQGSMRVENARGNVAEVFDVTGFAAIF